MKIINLTKGKVTIVDDEDFEKVNKFKWHARYSKKTKSYYAGRKESTGWKRGLHTGKGCGKTKIILLHREILGVTDPKIKVDHRNHDTLNNLKDNIRICTNSQNMMNRKCANSNSISGIRGVSYEKRRHKWRARIMVNKHEIYIGMFNDVREAAIAYANANKKYFGEFGGMV